MISRVSPKTTLADLFKLVCSEKNLDPYRHELRHPTTPDVALNMANSLGDYRLSEITVIKVGKCLALILSLFKQLNSTTKICDTIELYLAQEVKCFLLLFGIS